jgi:hypothetical protein
MKHASMLFFIKEYLSIDLHILPINKLLRLIEGFF